MPDPTFVNMHMTTTTTTTTTEVKLSNRSHIHTTAGRLKCAQIALNLLGFICILSTIMRYHPRGNWFEIVSTGGSIFSGIMLALYLFHVTDKCKLIPWIKIEFIFCTLWSIFYLIAASLAVDYRVNEAMAAAAFFGFAAMFAYLIDAYLKFQIIFGKAPVTKAERSPTSP